MRHLHLDFETFSLADLPSVGAYRYAFDPSTEILCAAMAFDQEEPVIWYQGIHNVDEYCLEPFYEALADPNVLIYAHYAQFEMAICEALIEKTWDIPCPDLSRFRCTLSLARRAVLPGKLEKLAECLQLKNLKDKRGFALIKKFSMLQPAARVSKKNPNGLPPYRIYPKDDPEAFQEFCDYCKQDVRAEQEIAKALEYFDEPINNAGFSIDAKINSRGVTVNVSALKQAKEIIEKEKEIVANDFRRVVGLEFTQRAKYLDWINNHGYQFENLQAETVETFLEDYEHLADSEVDEVVLSLRWKQRVSYAAIAKVDSMLACVGPHDNRIRGMLGYHGASTGRWVNLLVNFQNMKRPTIKDSVDAYKEMCEGMNHAWMIVCYGPPLEVLSSCIRHFVQDENGPLLNADFSNIEARVVCWLAGQEDALLEYASGIDRYKIMASMIYGISPDAVNDHPQRFVGKQATLGCSYGMGPPKFRATCLKFKYELPEGLEYTAVEAWRKKHQKVVKYWYDVDKAAKHAILFKGDVAVVRNVKFFCKEVAGMNFLLIRLPSGRKLAYPKPRVEDGQIVFYGHIEGVNWGDVRTYGGKLVENITQAVSMDLMLSGIMNAEAAGYETATLIHDQALSYFDKRKGQTPEEFTALLTTLPRWAEGLPMEAKGGLVPFYKKD